MQDFGHGFQAVHHAWAGDAHQEGIEFVNHAVSDGGDGFPSGAFCHHLGGDAVGRIRQEDDFRVYKAMYSLISSGLIAKIKAVKPPTPDASDGLTSVLTIYLDLLKTIQAYLEPVLGPRTATTIASWRPDHLPEQKSLFAKLHLGSPRATNLHYMHSTLEQLGDQQTACDIAVQSFNQFIKNILDQLPGMLEDATHQTLLKDIKRYLDRL